MTEQELEMLGIICFIRSKVQIDRSRENDDEKIT